MGTWVGSSGEGYHFIQTLTESIDPEKQTLVSRRDFKELMDRSILMIIPIELKEDDFNKIINAEIQQAKDAKSKSFAEAKEELKEIYNKFDVDEWLNGVKLCAQDLMEN